MEPRDLFKPVLTPCTWGSSQLISCLFKRRKDRRLKFKHNPIRTHTPPSKARWCVPVFLYHPSSQTGREAEREEGEVSSCLHCSNLTIWGNPWERGVSETVTFCTLFDLSSESFLNVTNQEHPVGRQGREGGGHRRQTRLILVFSHMAFRPLFWIPLRWSN